MKTCIIKNNVVPLHHQTIRHKEMETVTINNRTYTVTEEMPIQNAHATVVCMVLLIGKKGAAKIGVKYTDGRIEISSSL
jgi:hypothetical protein